MRKIYLFLIALLLVSPVMAADWDNVKSYDAEKKEITVTNLFGLGKEISQITLLTELDHLVIDRGPNVMQRVAEFRIKNNEDYGNALKKMELFDVQRSMKEMNREFEYRYREDNGYEDVPITNTSYCNGEDECVAPILDYRRDYKYNWIKLEESKLDELPEGNITLGIYLDVEEEERGEWIPTLFGVRINEWATWTSSLNTILTHYYHFNESSGTNALDSGGIGKTQVNITLVPQAPDIAEFISSGMFGGSVFVDTTGGSGSYAKTNANIGLSGTDTWFISLWVNRTDPHTDPAFLFGGSSGWPLYFSIKGGSAASASGVRINWGGSDTGTLAACFNSNGSAFNHVLWGQSAGRQLFYCDGTLLWNASFSSTTTNELRIGNQQYLDAESEINFDEMAVFNHSLTPGEISDLYNNGAGIRYATTFTSGPDITHPTNTTYSDQVTSMNYTQGGNAHCWYSLDGGATNSTPVVAGVNFTGLASGGGSSTWTTYCNDSSNTLASDSVTFFVDLGIETHLKAPVNDTNTTNALVEFEVNASTVGSLRLENQTIYIYYSNSTLLTSNYSGLSGQTSSRKFNHTFAQDGNYIWNALTKGNSSGVYLEDWDVNRTIFIDTTSPIIDITFPTKQIEFAKVGDVIDLNYTITETNPSSCYYVFNGTNHTISCGTNATIVVDDRNFTAQVWANDTLGNIGFDSQTWAFSLLEVDQTFSTNILEGSINEFRLNVSYLSSNFSNIQAFIHYNSTMYEGVQSAGTDSVEFSRNISAVVVAAKNNVSFYWEVKLTNATGTFPFNMSSQNQSVNNINVDLCTSHSILFINYSLKDEETQAFLNGTAGNSSVQFSLQMYPIGSNEAVINLSSNFSNNNNPKVCVENDLGDASYTIDLVTSYTAVDYAIEHNFIQNATITNSSLPQNIDLLDLKSADSTEFLITFKDESFLLIPDALIDIQRKYLDEGLFKTVEIQKTDETGNAVGHFDTDGVLYTIIVTKFGEILGIFNNIAVICQDAIIGDCDINLKAQGTITPLDDLEDIGNLSYTMVFDKDARTVTTIFSTTDGSIKTVSINTTKYDRFSNETVCSQQLTGSSGTLVCTIPASFGNATIISSLFIGSSPMTQLIQKVFTIQANVYQQFGDDMGALVIIMMLTIPFMAITSTIGFLISIVIGLVMASLLMVFSTSTIIGIGSSLVWLIIAVGILIYKIARRGTL